MLHSIALESPLDSQEINTWLESPFNCKEIKPVNSKGNQSWIFIGRTEAEAPILWPPDVKSQLIRKDPDAGKDWRQEEKGMTEDKMVGWHHQLNGSKFEQALEDVEGQGSLVYCSPWGCKESDKTEWLNNNNKYNQGFSDDSDGNKSACNARDPGLIPGLRRSSGEEMATHSSVFA